MKTEFIKMSGAGNDFIVLDNREAVISDASSAARKMCDRHNGIGADGLLLIESSLKAAYRMMYYNADGSYGGMCGNGGRCIAAFAVQKGIAPTSHEFEALDHLYRAEVTGDEVLLAMKDPVGLRTKVVLPVGKKRLTVFFVDTGSPHVVIRAGKLSKKGLEEIDVRATGQRIRRHKVFSPAGTNVNFVEVGPDKSLRVRTYERGVEAETLACGTGSIASAIYGCLEEGLRPPVVVVARSGEKLTVNFSLGKDGVIKDVTLKGPARVTFRGYFDV